MSTFRDGYIYRLCSPAKWQGVSRCDHFPYSELDATDGFFHLSSPQQVIETADKYYTAHPELVAVGCPEAAPGDLLKWEPSRGGQLFPHIYGDVLVKWFDHEVHLHLREGSFAPR